MSDGDHFIVVGASAAGITAAKTLRAEGWRGKLTLVGDEKCMPYDRPPLSKRLLAGACQASSLDLVTEESMRGLRLDFLHGVSAMALHPQDRAVELSDGTTHQYDRLLVATGARARTVPQLSDGKNCFNLRSMGDALAIRDRLSLGTRLVVVGSGFIGTELAAIAVSKGAVVTMIDKAETPLASRIGKVAGQRIQALHEQNGVSFHNQREISEVEWNGREIARVRLDDNTWIECDTVVVAVGATPNVEWLKGSGLSLRSGLVCNEFCAASRDIFAAGDVAEWFHGGYGTYLRLEHRTNAGEQAMTAAKNMLGAALRYRPLPFFWSDQYQVTVQSYGRIGPAFGVDYLHGGPDDDSFVLGFFDGPTLSGILSWNAFRKARDYLVRLKAHWLVPVS